MSHYSAAQWFEFGRDMVSPEQKASMQRHLDEGCQQCGKLVAIWREVSEIAQREQDYRPPVTAVSSAKAAFVTEKSWKWLPKIAEMARLIFDSFQQPVPAPVRGSAATSRQFLHEAKPFTIDLRVECEPARKWVHVIGQVLNSKAPGTPVTDVEVFLLRGEHLAARTAANDSGEFDLQFKAEEDLQLFVDIRGQKVVEVRLPTPFSDAECHGTVLGNPIGEKEER